MIAMSLNLLLAVLLLAALAYGVRLDRKLRAIRDGQEAFVRTAGELNHAVSLARSGLDELKSAADESTDLLGGRVKLARDIADRLETLIGKADRLEARPAPIASAEALAPVGIGGLSALLHDLKAAEAAAPRRRDARPASPRRPSVDDDLFEEAGGRA